jgi:hypothetical protein
LKQLGHRECLKVASLSSRESPNKSDFEVNGTAAGNLSIYCSGFCSAVIQHYAFKGNKVAQFSLTKFSTSGIDHWIQQQTGWHQETNDNGQLHSQLSQLTGIVTNLAMSVSALVEPTKRKNLKADLNHPNPEIKEIPTRTKVRKLVVEYCHTTNQNYRNVYRQLYDQYKLRYGYDVCRRAGEANQKCNLAQLEADNEIDRFHQMVTILTGAQA